MIARLVPVILSLVGAAWPAVAADATIASLDLARAFDTRSPWRFTATQGPEMADPVAAQDTVAGAIRFCISADGGRTCRPALDGLLVVPGVKDIFDVPHALQRAAIVRADGRTPLLLMQAASLPSMNNDQRRATILLAYDRARDRFATVYETRVDRNNNQAVRFVESGPLRGAVISAIPTGDAPFAYWITVNRLVDGRYAPVLRFRSATRYGDGNTLPVIDSEMPGILRRLGLWHPGMELLLPAGSCPHPHLSGGSLWCRP